METNGQEIYKALYDPPITGMPLTTLDLPVAGKGYNALPFVFDLVNYCNNVRLGDSTSKQDENVLPPDVDGRVTVEYLKTVRRKLERITGDSPRSLGLHPVVYFYTRSGTFQPTVLLAVSGFVEDIAARHKLVKFTVQRRAFEDFLIEHKEATTLLIKQLGSGPRHIPRLREYYARILRGLIAGKGADAIQADFAADSDFAFLTSPRPTDQRPAPITSQGSFKRTTKTAAFFAAALPTGTRCSLCGALVHKNSVNFDHEVPRREAGPTDMANARVTHPYCNSIRDHLPA